MCYAFSKAAFSCLHSVRAERVAISSACVRTSPFGEEEFGQPALLITSYFKKLNPAEVSRKYDTFSVDHATG
jgi:hypothetical protein